jgi:hypothetical protein
MPLRALTFKSQQGVYGRLLLKNFKGVQDVFAGCLLVQEELNHESLIEVVWNKHNLP